MFRGTYTSDFYRAVRDLLHEQVSLQSRQETSLNDTEHHRAKSGLERRWQALISSEHEYRSEGYLSNAAALSVSDNPARSGLL
jgi:anaerobic magnesium-protoporphyrin IX monomethyl ester cyclase